MGYTYVRYISDNLYHIIIKDIEERGIVFPLGTPIIKSYKKMICDGGPNSRIDESVSNHIKRDGYVFMGDGSVYIDMNKKIDTKNAEVYHLQLELTCYIVTGKQIGRAHV